MGCSHDCSNCSEKCSKESLLAPKNPASSIKRVIGVVSGKGGVGKSLVTSMLAVAMQRRGYKSAILDADITGPSIPKSFGLKCGSVEGSDIGMFPPRTKTGIEVMSVNLLMDEETKPVVWRGPVIAGVVKQFWSEVVWGEVDFMFVDMPPGTGDVPLTVFQSLPLDGIVIVTSPQELVSHWGRLTVTPVHSLESYTCTDISRAGMWGKGGRVKGRLRASAGRVWEELAWHRWSQRRGALGSPREQGW